MAKRRTKGKNSGVRLTSVQVQQLWSVIVGLMQRCDHYDHEWTAQDRRSLEAAFANLKRKAPFKFEDAPGIVLPTAREQALILQPGADMAGL